MQIVITDTSVILNLFATGVIEEILEQLEHDFMLCPAVRGEALFIRNAHSNEREKIELQPLIDDALMLEADLDSQIEEELFITYSIEMGPGSDGEAMCFTLAQTRGFVAAVDDKRARRRALKVDGAQSVELVDSVELLRQWQLIASVDEERMKGIIRLIEVRARFKPPKSHSLSGWWDNPAM